MLGECKQGIWLENWRVNTQTYEDCVSRKKEINTNFEILKCNIHVESEHLNLYRE